MTKYEQAVDDEPLIVDADGINFACCDCGLVHHLSASLQDGEIVVTFRRDNRKTAAIRRYHKNLEYQKVKP